MPYKDPQKNKECINKWREENKEYLKEYSKEWRDFNKDKLIDHIKPLSLFNLSDRKQFLEATHFSNMQPLWAKENISKGNKISPKIERSITSITTQQDTQLIKK